MIPIASEETEKLARVLSKYAPRATIARSAGLLTAPNLQANTIRLEVLVHLAVAYCAGNIKPGYAELGRWLNQYLGQTQMALWEDPVEDVFVTNVHVPEGNRRVFEGIWESNDYFLQVVLDTLLNRNAPQACHDLLKSAYALLQLSDTVAERLGLHRWHIESSNSKGIVPVAPVMHIEDRARAVTFTKDDLEKLGVGRELLTPFIFREEDKVTLKVESTGHTTLELRPLVDFSDALVLALPHAVSPAIRRFMLSELRKMGYLQAFGDVLAAHQARQIEKDGLRELKNDAESLTPPLADGGPMPSLHAWLLKYDTNKYLHVVLLHDRLDWLDEQGLSSALEYPEPVRAGLERYLSQVTAYCKALPGFAEGMTLLVMGGLGRGFMLGFNDWPDDGWRWSAIRVSDLLMLAGEIDQPINRYLKCIKQKVWAENQGVYFMNINGDFNFYCYWRSFNYQLIPRELKVDSGSMVGVGHDFVLQVRKELRNLVDQHLMQTADGQFVQSMRFGRDAYFKSMQGRPIYVSLGHLRTGVLAGAVETLRGPTWLVVEPRDGDDSVRHLLYQMWSGFLGLFDRLVTEIEALLHHLASGAIEIRLNFRDLIVPDEYVVTKTNIPIAEPVVLVNLDQRMVEIRFPSDFLVNFQQHENTGEKLVLCALAKGLVRLHQASPSGSDDNEALIEILLEKIIGDVGMRVLHLFHTYYPIEYLLAQQNQTPVFLSHEDFVFSKLRLSEGCTEIKPEAELKTKDECNDFLHKVVAKVWGQLRTQLQQFNRASVIRQTLALHEAVIQDRDHWRRTAQAIISLYKPDEDVFAVARKRESDRNQISLPARTIMEMAICECSAAGGRALSQWELDDLLAKAALLVETATDSDAIKGELVEPVIRLHANGEYTIDRSFHETVITPFLTNYLREEFEGAAGDYSRLYQRERRTERKRADDIYSAEFNNAFKTEFGLTPDEAVDGFAELMDLAVEQNNVVVQTTLGELRERLILRRGISIDACESYFRTFGLFHRSSWQQPPEGFNNKDIEPWRFRRRLSATVRPLLIFGEQDSDAVFFGAGALQLGFAYLLERAESGQLPADKFFVTTAMKKYIGAVNDERGHAFAKSIAEELRRQGWQARNELRMSELGAPRKAADGDIDVLAWKPSGEVLLIECKRLQLARTVAEIAEICRRFRGEAKDELDKHVRRSKWVSQNPSSLERIIGFIPSHDAIDARLVTNTHVPMMYLESLPIPSDKIGPLTLS
ncbi:MAG: hypothetical protein PHY62_06840 [Gallionella sp.]|nr:hypothetical protein [Gallionella sp.]